ncbi:MAG: transporter substrate-binding domain-containing protein [Proteobacteria bacterium]|nr:transporter substrate-binding domain-containing protein [Pseudomonadota bacterium]
MRGLMKAATAFGMAIAIAAGGSANAADFPAGSKMDQLAKAGKIRVGVQTQYPLIGMKTLSGYEGFDVDVARLIAAKLGIKKDGIEFVPVTTPTREPFLEQDKVDMIIAAYSITPNREKVIDFAGPYLPSPSAVMVKKGNPLGIKSMKDLIGKKLCGPSGSNQESYISEHFPEVRKTMVLFDSSAKCAQAVINGQADASTTEVAILAALSKQNDGQLQVLGINYDMSLYGVGLKKTDDKTFCKWINKTLEEAYKDGSWAKAYNDTIGTVVPGGAPKLPAIGASCPG